MEANKWKERHHREKSRVGAHKLAGKPIHGHLPAIQRARKVSQKAENDSGDVVSTLRYPATNFRHNSARKATGSSVGFTGFSSLKCA